MARSDDILRENYERLRQQKLDEDVRNIQGTTKIGLKALYWLIIVVFIIGVLVSCTRQVKLTGQSGKTYNYRWAAMDSSTRDRKDHAVNYVFAKKSADGKWIYIYIADTDNMRHHPPDDETLASVRRHGATHILTHLSISDEEFRRAEVSDLVLKLDPVCNRETMEGQQDESVVPSEAVPSASSDVR